ncbi:MAG TPA: hypothetical protein PK668_19075 [Myxococcota bacterium]|nr:hypothetical protein [Myxococcota bacterium]HRY95166.1 hypothetical protein [Myxococcota bacterium]HSA20913.1 hypothetical protein [Myxococcota bacterium]
MRWATRHLLISASSVGLCLLLGDGLDLLPPERPTAPGLGQAQAGPLLAQARRRRAPRKKPAPKPAPAPAPEPTAPEPAPEPAASPEGSGAGAALPVGPGGTTRVEFEGMQIKGQTTKAGEVQILERKDNALKSMVKRRTSYREEIIQTVFPEQAESL